MNALRLTRRVTTFRRTEGATNVHSDIQIQAYISKNKLRARLVKPARPSIAVKLESTVAAAHAAMRSQMTSSHHRDLIIEAGRVEQTGAGSVDPLRMEDCTYLLVINRGVVLLLEENANDASRTYPLLLTGQRFQLDEVDGELFVMFGPSAVLALLDYYLEMAAGRHDGRVSMQLNPLLSVDNACQSPYPPHNLVQNLRTEETGTAEPIKLCSPENSAHSLLVHPEQWGRPFGALAHDFMSSLAIDFESKAATPDRSLLVESLVPLAGGKGEIEWQAECSLMDGDQRIATSANPFILHFDASDALSAVRGSVSAPAPALVWDPIAGERFGLAPAFITNISAEDLCINT